MVRIANHVGMMRANILLEVATAAGVVWLGSALFATLRKYGEKMALVALGLYILEAALLASSRAAALSLLSISLDYVSTGRPVYLQPEATLAFALMDSGYKLLMLPFCLGAVLFYSLLYKSRVVPRALSLWGLLSLFLVFVGMLFSFCGVEAPFYLFIPYVPFEFAIGIWILIMGVKVNSESNLSRNDLGPN